MAIKEFCGLFGIYGSPEAAHLTYLGLYALQHRGEESAGIVVTDGQRLTHQKGMGLVSDVFDEDKLARLSGSAAIGHVRYSTTGSSNLNNTQPLVVTYAGGPLAVAHNGNLVNSQVLRESYEARGSIFQTTTDSEVIVHLMADPANLNRDDAIARALREIKGAYSLLFLTPSAMIAARDPHGWRPLVLGRLDDAWVVASETSAFDLVGVEFIREVEPGEIVIIDDDGIRSEWITPKGSVTPAHCIFEQVYFARPDSFMFGDNVHAVRKRFGAQLAREHAVDADIVVSVPDSGNSAAMGYAEESGIPLERGFIRNHYVGRTFIKPGADSRAAGVQIKLNIVKDVVKDKRVVVIDDSIIRGNTSRARIKQLRDAGAKEVHFRISCPPTLSPCFYGIDFPTTTELIAANKTLDEIRDHLELDSIGYLSLEGMLSCVSQPETHYCTACWTGNYRVSIDDPVHQEVLQQLARTTAE
jgi:amidophosphoribosyltransferase